jgi:hypothetical protein
MQKKIELRKVKVGEEPKKELKIFIEGKEFTDIEAVLEELGLHKPLVIHLHNTTITLPKNMRANMVCWKKIFSAIKKGYDKIYYTRCGENIALYLKDELEIKEQKIEHNVGVKLEGDEAWNSSFWHYPLGPKELPLIPANCIGYEIIKKAEVVNGKFAREYGEPHDIIRYYVIKTAQG